MPTDDRPFAENRPQLPDSALQKVSIMVRIVARRIVGFDGGALPDLGDCIGDLVIPERAVRNPEVLRQLTDKTTQQLFDKGARLLCRLGARHIPASLRAKCRAAKVENSPRPGAFVEIILDEPLL